MSRILGAVLLFFIEPLSLWFYIIYTAAGVTDLLDGFIARITHSQSELGSQLDSVADLILYICLALRILPELYLRLPRVIWAAVATVLAIRLSAYITAYLKFRRFASIHTYLNKLTSAAVFLIPYALLLGVETAYCWTGAVISFLASLEELVIHLISRDYPSGKKSLFLHSKK